MADDNVKYQHKTVQTIRGTEARSISKWESQGWELIDQAPGKLRTTLSFRKPARHISWLPIAAMLGIVALILAIVGIVSLFQGENDDADASTEPVSTTSSSEVPSETATEARPEEAFTGSEDSDDVITVKNNEQFAALLRGSECSKRVETFVSNNADRTIEFDGGIADMAPHENFETRYDILITPGDKGPMATVGPYFKFEDVNTGDLNFTGTVPARFGTGTLIHVVADIDKYDPQTCLFFLEPVSTEIRE